jgi:YhcH/YjgK/YiaL family protein
MLNSSINAASNWRPFSNNPIILNSLDWIVKNGDRSEIGIYELGQTGWFVNVHGYKTQTREECTWENHTKTIDIQYMIDGAECIDITPVDQLGAPGLFKPESDTQKFAASNLPTSQIVLRPGDFAIFMPGEAHRPKIAVGDRCDLKKLVIKIPVDLLNLINPVL